MSYLFQRQFLSTLPLSNHTPTSRNHKPPKNRKRHQSPKRPPLLLAPHRRHIHLRKKPPRTRPKQQKRHYPHKAHSFRENPAFETSEMVEMLDKVFENDAERLDGEELQRAGGGEGELGGEVAYLVEDAWGVVRVVGL